MRPEMRQRPTCRDFAKIRNASGSCLCGLRLPEEICTSGHIGDCEQGAAFWLFRSFVTRAKARGEPRNLRPGGEDHADQKKDRCRKGIRHEQQVSKTALQGTACEENCRERFQSVYNKATWANKFEIFASSKTLETFPLGKVYLTRRPAH